MYGDTKKATNMLLAEKARKVKNMLKLQQVLICFLLYMKMKLSMKFPEKRQRNVLLLQYHIGLL